MRVGHVRNRLRVRDAQGLAHRVGMGVLDRDEAADRFVGVLRVTEGRRDEVQVQRAVGPVREGPDARPDDDGVAGGLVHDEMALGARDRLLAAAQVRHLRHEVAHRARGDEEAGLLPEQRGRALLERIDGRVVAEDVVTDLRLRHRATHRGRGVGDGVRAQVDPVHGLARISRLGRRRVRGDVRGRFRCLRRLGDAAPRAGERQPGSDSIARPLLPSAGRGPVV